MIIDREVKKQKLTNDLAASKYFIWIAKTYWRNADRYWTWIAYQKYTNSVVYRLENILKVLKRLY